MCTESAQANRGWQAVVSSCIHVKTDFARSINETAESQTTDTGWMWQLELKEMESCSHKLPRDAKPCKFTVVSQGQWIFYGSCIGRKQSTMTWSVRTSVDTWATVATLLHTDAFVTVPLKMCWLKGSNKFQTVYFQPREEYGSALISWSLLCFHRCCKTQVLMVYFSPPHAYLKATDFFFLHMNKLCSYSPPC